MFNFFIVSLIMVLEVFLNIFDLGFMCVNNKVIVLNFFNL